MKVPIERLNQLGITADKMFLFAEYLGYDTEKMTVEDWQKVLNEYALLDEWDGRDEPRT